MVCTTIKRKCPPEEISSVRKVKAIKMKVRVVHLRPRHTRAQLDQMWNEKLSIGIIWLTFTGVGKKKKLSFFPVISGRIALSGRRSCKMTSPGGTGRYQQPQNNKNTTAPFLDRAKFRNFPLSKHRRRNKVEGSWGYPKVNCNTIDYWLILRDVT